MRLEFESATAEREEYLLQSGTLETKVGMRIALAHRQNAEFSIYHFPFEIFHLNNARYVTRHRSRFWSGQMKNEKS
jgi:hypothetical protein